MMRRVLYIEGCRDGTVGGSHVCLVRMLEKLDRTRFAPTVVMYDDNQITSRLRAMGVEVVVLESELPFSFARPKGPGWFEKHAVRPALLSIQKAGNFTWRFLRPALAHARFMRRGRFDLVHLNNSIGSNHEWMLAARLAQVRMISHERGATATLSASSRLYGRWASRHVCVSRAIQDALTRSGIPAERSIVAYDGVDPEHVRPSRAASEVRGKLNIPLTAPVVGVVGNLKRWKGQDTLVRAAALLAGRWPELRCLFVGGMALGDPFPGELERLASVLGLGGRVILAGFQEHAADLMNIMDVVVHTSITAEPFGMVIIEAMMLRKPVVATRLGGPTEVIDDGRNGFLVEPADPVALAARLDVLLADPALRREVGDAAHAAVCAKFTLASTLRSVERVYDEA